jgi:hypothetical protein
MTFRARQPGFPCCDDDCRIPITGWNQVAGTWTVDGDNLETDDSDALAVTTNEHPQELATHVVRVKARGKDDLDRLRVIIAYEDSDNYLFAEMQVRTTFGWLRFWKVDTGVAQQIGTNQLVSDLKASEWFNAKVCFDGETLTAIINDTFFYSQPATASDDGTRVGVGTGSISEKVKFEEFEWWIHYVESGPYEEGNDCPRCLPLGCVHCALEQTPQAYLVQFDNIRSAADCALQNCESLNASFIVPATFPCGWRYDKQTNSICEDGTSITERISIVIQHELTAASEYRTKIILNLVHDESGISTAVFTAEWRKVWSVWPDKIQCLSIDEEDIPLFRDDYPLEGRWCIAESFILGNATCTLTAI